MDYSKLTKQELIKLLMEKEPDTSNIPSEVFNILKPFWSSKQEKMLVLMRNGSGSIFKVETVSIGLINKTIVHPREVFAPAIENRACSILIAHNHPSGSLTPSEYDFEVTNAIKKAGDILGIPVLDHIIFTNKNYYSFFEHGTF